VRFFLKSILFLVLVFPVTTYFDSVHSAAEETSGGIGYEYSKVNILGFINHLVSKEEYYRAFVELKRIESYYPGYIKKENLYTTELFLLFKGHQYPEILAKEFTGVEPNTRAIHSIFAIDSMIERSEFFKAKTILDSTGYSGYNKDINLFLFKRTILSYLLLNMIDNASAIAKNNLLHSDTDNYKIKFSELAEYSTNYYNAYKKPYNAIVFGTIPGMGYVYAGQKATGLIALVLVSALSTLTYYSFKTDNKPAGIFVGAAASFFYGGSIVGGYLSTRKYNESVTENMKNSLSTKLDIKEDRDRIYNIYGAGSGGK
jgi:hypothetical protein